MAGRCCSFALCGADDEGRVDVPLKAWRRGDVVGIEDRWFAWRIGAFFGALFLVYGTSLPYLPVLLDARGLTAAEIGIVSSVPLIVRLLLTPLIAIHADRHGDHRQVVIGLSAIGFAMALSLLAARGFWPILLCATAFLVAIQSIMPLIETIAMAGVSRGGHDYGRMRLWGSATFILITFVGAALIDWRGAGVIIGLLIVGAVLTLGAALALPRPRRPAPGHETGAHTAKSRLDLTSARSLITARPMILFLLAAGAAQSAHAVFYAFGVLHWRATGVSASWIGLLWSIGVVAEIALFWWSKPVLARVSAVDLIAIGAAVSVFRWTMMAFDPNLPALFALQILHGLTYGASHLGAMHYIQARVPPGQAGTAQALYSTVTAGIGMGLAMLFAGFAYQRYGGLSYLGMAVLGGVSLIAAVALRRSTPKATAVPVRSNHPE